MLFYFLDVYHASSQKPVVLQTILPCFRKTHAPLYLVLQFFMFSLGAWTVVLRLCLGEDTSTSTFGEPLASWITLVGMVMVYVGYSFGMSQVIKANFRCPLERYTDCSIC